MKPLIILTSFTIFICCMISALYKKVVQLVIMTCILENSTNWNHISIDSFFDFSTASSWPAFVFLMCSALTQCKHTHARTHTHTHTHARTHTHFDCYSCLSAHKPLLIASLVTQHTLQRDHGKPCAACCTTHWPPRRNRQCCFCCCSFLCPPYCCTF